MSINEQNSISKTVKYKVSTPKFSIPATEEAIVLFIKGTLKVQDIVKLYGFVSKNKLDEIIEQKFDNENVNIVFRKECREILLQNANYIEPNRYEIYFKPSIHFMVRMVGKTFDLNVFIPLYQFVTNGYLKEQEIVELDTGKTTIVFAKYGNIIKLITAWPGSRDNEPYEDLKTSA